MLYFFVLGNNRSLAAAEIGAVLGWQKNPANQRFIGAGEVLFWETAEAINPVQLINKLGGTIKIGEIKATISGQAELLEAMKKNLPTARGKFKFGFSFYGQNKLPLKSLAMELKKYLREVQGVNSQWVVSREKTLSSVVVEQNKLIDPGVEFFLAKEKNFFLGRTLAVQPFKDFSRRDYGRPKRDDYAGMLPPKLAKIMINLANVPPDKTILDPFCGSGTILTEALVMNYENLIGSDIEKEALANTEKNLAWVAENWQKNKNKIRLCQKDARQLSAILKPRSLEAIITEPYLGPQRGFYDLSKTKKELESLYGESLKVFSSLIKKEGRIVMIWPVFRQSGTLVFLNPPLPDFKIIPVLPENWQLKEITKRNTIIYGRPEQKIWREIVVLELA